MYITHTSPIFLRLSHTLFSLHTFLHVFVALHCPGIPVTCNAPLLVRSVLMRSTAAQHSPPCFVCTAHVLDHCRLMHVTGGCTLRRCHNARLVYQQSDVFRDPFIWDCLCADTLDASLIVEIIKVVLTEMTVMEHMNCLLL
jgi:hypothetical protein